MTVRRQDLQKSFADLEYTLDIYAVAEYILFMAR